MNYDPANIFARILRGEIPCDRVFESEHTLAFRDISPQAPAHLLVIPKGKYQNFTDFATTGADAELCAFFRDIATIAKQQGLHKTGYRLLVNNGADANQEVPHLHIHIVGGANLGRMLPPR
ncbi:MAG: histidine triad nucleotide-binding protein [Gammaproteobacteria bacterium]